MLNYPFKNIMTLALYKVKTKKMQEIYKKNQMLQRVIW